MRHRWLLTPPDAAPTAQLAVELGISTLLARCLMNRGVRGAAEAEVFLQPRLRQLADPALLPNVDVAVQRLWEAHARREPVVVFGDYDVDGVTATALLLQVLRPLGWHAVAYLPHRLDEGYGLTREAAENCLQRQTVKLLIAVDCGSTARETVAWLTARGVDVIVLDHHQISTPTPTPVALVNPQLGSESSAPFRELASVGLAFKLAHALVKRGRERSIPAAEAFDVRPLLDLVALGTIADMVPVTGENRILVTAGLERINTLRRPGILALKQVAQIEGPIGPYEVGFQLGPRLNAAGRLENATEALDLLLVEELGRAEALARSLDARNRERQQIERHIADEVIGALRASFNPETDFAIVEGQLLWHLGVVGIVASRVLQEFYRPTIILGGDGEEWRGSGRSIEGFDLAAALRQCQDLLVRHGGHAMAAGLTVRPDKVPELRTRLNALARQGLTPEQLQPPLRLDAELCLSKLTVAQVAELERLRPFGQGNPPVQLVIPNLQLRGPPLRIGREQQHLKLFVKNGQTAGEAVWWGGASKPWPEGMFDLACAPQLNTYNNRISVQLKVLDWQPTRG